MFDFSLSSNLEWGWIQFVGLWLLSPLVLIVAATTLIQHWRGRRHK